MKNLISAVSAVLLLSACGQDTAPLTEDVASEPSKIFDMPYLMRDLDNGLRVIVVPTDYPDIVTIQIPVQTGSRNEVEAGKTGFAHFFEHMMFRGTEKYPADVYSDILKKAGADQNAYTTDDYTNYHITFTKDDLEKVIELEADRFQKLSYSEEDFRTEALAVNGEYLKNFSNPISKMFERLSDLMYTEHTYKHTTMGFIEDIEAMPDQIEYSLTFFDRWYRPEKTVVILVGDVDAEATFELVKKYWGDWERGDYNIDVPVEPPLGGPKYEHMQWDSPTQPWLVMAYRGPAYQPTEKDMPSLDLLSSVYLSDSSALYRKLVIQDQSVDQLFGYFPDQKDPGMLMIFARLTDAAHSVDVRDAINATLVEARTQLVDTKKVEETKSRLRFGFRIVAGINLVNCFGSAKELHEARKIRADVAGIIQLRRESVTQTRFGLCNFLRIHQLRPCFDQRGIDCITDVRGVLRVRQPCGNYEQARVYLIRKIAEQLIHRLILDHKFTIQIGRVGKIDR